MFKFLNKNGPPKTKKKKKKKKKKRKGKEIFVLFNDELNTFYFRLYDVRELVKDDSDGE